MATVELDKDLAKTLQAAKAKPHNFAIIAKGANVLKLILDKKPLKEGQLVKAKKEVQGNAIVQGVVCGDGSDLVFQVLEEPSITEPKLKTFITETTRLTLKPRFQVVTNLPEVNEEASEGAPEVPDPTPPADIAPPPTQPAPPAPQAQAPAPPPSDGDKVRFAAQLKALKPDLDKVKAANTSVTQELNQRAAELAVLAKDGSFTTALDVLGKVADLVRRGLQELESPTPSGGDAAGAFNARLRALMPQIKDALAAGGTRGDEIKQATTQAGAFAKQQDFAQAGLVLDRVEELLRTPVPSGTAGPTERPVGTLAIWREAREQVDEQLTELQDALRDTDDEYLTQIADQGLSRTSKQLHVGLHVALLEFDQASGEAKAKAAQKARARTAEFRKFLASDPALPLLEDNPLEVAVDIRKRLSAALDEIENLLAS